MQSPLINKLSALIIILSVGLSLSINAYAKLWEVGSTSEHSLQEVLSYAKDGDTILVKGGAHKGPFFLRKKVTLIGRGNPLLLGDGTGSVVTVLSNGIHLTGFTIQNSGSDPMDEPAGIFLKSNRNLIEDCVISDVLYGIYLYSSHGNTIRGNKIQTRKSVPMSERGSGIHLWNSNDNVLSENEISFARDGLYFDHAYKNSVKDTVIHHLRYGLHYMFCDGNTIENVLSYENLAGCALMYSRGMLVRGNAFIKNRSASAVGLLLKDLNDSVIESNLFLGNVTAIFIDNSHRNLFRNNQLYGNDLAIQLYPSSLENTFTKNNFINNLSPILLVGVRTTTKWAQDGLGNYWDNYNGYDLNGDGIGDISYHIQDVFQLLAGTHPGLRLYLDSPTARAIAFSESVFPIIRVSEDYDPAPLMKPVPFTVDSFPAYAHRNKASSSPLTLNIALPLFLFISSLVTIVWAKRL